LVRSSISSKISHESVIGVSGQSVHSIENVTGSVARNVVSAAKSVIAAASLSAPVSSSADPPELQAARPRRAAAATSAVARRPARRVGRGVRSRFMSLL
jgi:hypothetical protein